MHNRADVQAKVLATALKDRMNLQDLSGNIDVPKATLHRIFKEGNLKRHSSALKPKLTDRNKNWRYDFARSKIDWSSEYDLRSGVKLVDFMDEIHVDEKWFYLLKEGQRYYLAPGEQLPHLTIQSKNYLPKVMFLSAVARPRYLPHEGKWFDGKIGMWPIGYYKPTARASKNRPAGTLEFVSEIVDPKKYRQLLITEVLPAILRKWPHNIWEGKPIYIQQDGAQSHLAAERVNDYGPFNIVNDKEWLEELEHLGLKDRIHLVTQPANSPDLNINDLGFFASIQSEY